MKVQAQDNRLQRIDAYQLTLPNAWNIPIRMFASAEIPLPGEAVDELQSVLAIQDTVSHIREIAPDFLDPRSDPCLLEVVLTPDFHKGAGIPIGIVLVTRGFAVPQAIGNDVNCGMRLMATSLNREQVSAKLEDLERTLRRIFFEGGRDIPMTPTQREAMVRYGLPGLVETHREAGDKGLWGYFNEPEEEANLGRMHGGGGYPTESVFALQDYIESSRGLSYDSMIGSLGGGNHFAEIQYVRRVLDGAAAHAWGLREDQVVVMIHTGSLGLGHVMGTYVMDAMKDIYPAGVAHPENGIYVLPAGERFAAEFDRFRTSMRNAANFAFGNRFFLSLMVRRGLESAVRETDAKVIYDAPHNLMWEETLDGNPVFLHRKGATPAGGWDAMADTAYAYWGEPVIVPGSMGAPSYLLLSMGNRPALYSACHGAGRQISRGAAMHVDDSELDAFLQAFRVVTPIDPKRPEVRTRRDILEKWRQALKQEAPFAYKDISPVIETLKGADVARPVVELFPLMTAKA